MAIPRLNELLPNLNFDIIKIVSSAACGVASSAFDTGTKLHFVGLEKLSPESPLQLKTKYMFQSVFFCEYVWWHNRVNPMSYRPQKYGYSRCTFGALPRVRASQIRHHVSPGFPPTSSKTGRLRENYIRRVSKNKKLFSKLKITCFFLMIPGLYLDVIC